MNATDTIPAPVAEAIVSLVRHDMGFCELGDVRPQAGRDHYGDPVVFVHADDDHAPAGATRPQPLLLQAACVFTHAA